MGTAAQSAKGKLDLGSNAAAELQTYCRQLRVTTIDVSAEHVYKTFQLDGIHKDPFDRILIAQAQVEGLTLVTRDQFIPSTRFRQSGEVGRSPLRFP